MVADRPGARSVVPAAGGRGQIAVNAFSARRRRLLCGRARTLSLERIAARGRLVAGRAPPLPAMKLAQRASPTDEE